MNRNITELVFILDRSGSMHGLESDTIGGFNSMLCRQQKEPGACRITTVLFNDDCLLVHDRVPLDEVAPMDGQTYRVDGCTALMDAVGVTIQRIALAQQTAAPEERADNVMFVIITDGLENASRMFSLGQIREMIRMERERNGWEFIFLGANIDAESAAESMGIARERAVNYRSDCIGTRKNFDAVSEAASAMRSESFLDPSWRDSIDEDFNSRGGDWG